MIDDSKRRPGGASRVQRRHELDVEPHAHPGEPRRVVSTDHESGWREPSPVVARAPAREAHGH